jgi:hypothetical protein
MTGAARLDPRLNAYRPEIADARLKGVVEARTFATGSLKRVIAGSAPLKRTPSPDAPLDSEVIRGELVRVFADYESGWTFSQCEADSYVGFVPTDVLSDSTPEPTHRVTALRTFLYPVADLRLPPVMTLYAGSVVACEGETTTRGTPYRLLAGGEGAVVAVALEPVETPLPDDHVAVAERFVGTPYLWGGRTARGLDCSGFVQLVLSLTGRPAPRDTDLQASMIGEPVTGGLEGGLRRGDLVFWRGHALIMRDEDSIIHCSGHHMRVLIEPAREAFDRVMAILGPPLAVRRV